MGRAARKRPKPGEFQIGGGAYFCSGAQKFFLIWISAFHSATKRHSRNTVDSQFIHLNLVLAYDPGSNLGKSDQDQPIHHSVFSSSQSVAQDNNRAWRYWKYCFRTWTPLLRKSSTHWTQCLLPNILWTGWSTFQLASGAGAFIAV